MKEQIIKSWRCNNIEKFKQVYEFDESIVEVIIKYYESTKEYDKGLENEEVFLDVILEDVNELQKLFIIRTMKQCSLDYKKFFK